MKVTVTAPSDTARELMIEVPAEVVIEAINKEAEKMRKSSPEVNQVALWHSDRSNSY